MMLGVRRASVTTAVGILQRAGAIDFIRGHVEIRDQHALERISCECYTTVRREHPPLQPG